LRLDEANSERGERQSEAELQARRNAARQGVCEAADDSRYGEDQKHRADHKTGTGDRCFDQHCADAAFIGWTAIGTP